MAVAVPRHLLGDDDLPAGPLRRARQPILSAVAIASHFARRRREVPRGFCAGRGGQHLWPSPSPIISLATPNFPRGFYTGRGGLYPWPSPSPGISPGDAKKSRAASAQDKAANTYSRRRRPASPWQRQSPRPTFERGAAAYILGRHCRLASCLASPRSPARLLRGERRPTPMAVAFAWHLGRRRRSPRAASAQMRRPTLSAVTVVLHPARRRREVPARLLRGARWPSPDISSATTKSPRGFCAGARRLKLLVVAVTWHLARRRQEVPARLLRGVRPPTPIAAAVARHLLSNEEVPEWLLRAARRPILSAVAVT